MSASNSVDSLPQNKKRKCISRRSWVWRYFPFEQNKKLFICTICGTAVEIYGSSTTELIRHLWADHKIWEQTPNACFSIGSVTLEESSDEYSDNETAAYPEVIVVIVIK